MKCIRERCYSPTACNGFGYCRERNFDGLPIDDIQNERRTREQLEAERPIKPTDQPQ